MIFYDYEVTELSNGDFNFKYFFQKAFDFKLFKENLDDEEVWLFSEQCPKLFRSGVTKSF